MGISFLTRKTSHAGNSVATSFSFGFKVFQTSQLKVVIVPASGDPATKTLGSDYSVTLNGSEGGTVTMTVPPATGETLWIISLVPFTQPDALESGPMPPDTIEQMVDRVTVLTQQLKEALDRAPRFSETTTSSTPTMAEPESGKFLYWDAEGNLQNNSLTTTSALILDEDNMASNSDTNPPSQQSTKAYVDNSIAGLVLAPQSKTASATLAISERYVEADASSAGFTLTLPTAVGNAGQRFFIFKPLSDTSHNVVTIDGNGSETIGGASSVSLNTEGEGISIVSNGVNWLVFNRHIPMRYSSFTPVFNGFGDPSPSTVNCHWARDRKDMILSVEFQIGTATAVEGRIGLPGSLTLSTSPLDTTKVLGGMITSYTTTGGVSYHILGLGGNSYVNFGRSGTSTSGLTALAGNVIGSNEQISFTVRAPIAQWS